MRLLTSLTLSVLTAAVRCCTCLLLKQLRSQGLSARNLWRSKVLCHLPFGHSSPPTDDTALWFPRVNHGTLVFDPPVDRSGFDGQLDIARLVEELKGMAQTFTEMTAIPPGFEPTGQIMGAVMPDGTIRTERWGVHELNHSDSVDPSCPVADVIDIRRRYRP